MTSNRKPRVVLVTVTTEITMSQFVGRAIRRIRKERGITQADMSDYMGIPRPSLSNLENGGIFISVDHIKLVCDFFNIHSSELLPF